MTTEQTLSAEEAHVLCSKATEQRLNRLRGEIVLSIDCQTGLKARIRLLSRSDNSVSFTANEDRAIWWKAPKQPRVTEPSVETVLSNRCSQAQG